MINVMFDIRINDDTIMEDNENFILTIDPSSLPTRVTVGSPDQAIVTIMDNDGKHYFCHDDICIYCKTKVIVKIIIIC